jgi:hypothetical protein
LASTGRVDINGSLALMGKVGINGVDTRSRRQQESSASMWKIGGDGKIGFDVRAR